MFDLITGIVTRRTSEGPYVPVTLLAPTVASHRHQRRRTERLRTRHLVGARPSLARRVTDLGLRQAARVGKLSPA